jgi:hypothetical protein
MLRVEGLVRDPQSPSSKLGTTDSLSSVPAYRATLRNVLLVKVVPLLIERSGIILTVPNQ